MVVPAKWASSAGRVLVWRKSAGVVVTVFVRGARPSCQRCTSTAIFNVGRATSQSDAGSGSEIAPACHGVPCGRSSGGVAHQWHTPPEPDGFRPVSRPANCEYRVGRRRLALASRHARWLYDAAWKSRALGPRHSSDVSAGAADAPSGVGLPINPDNSHKIYCWHVTGRPGCCCWLSLSVP